MRDRDRGWVFSDKVWGWLGAGDALGDVDAEAGRDGLAADGALGELLGAIADGKLPKARAKESFELMLSEGVDVDGAIAKLGIEQVDESELVALCQALLDENPKIVADVQNGKQQAVGALIGQAKKRNPNVDPGRVREICLELVEQM